VQPRHLVVVLRVSEKTIAKERVADVLQGPSGAEIIFLPSRHRGVELKCVPAAAEPAVESDEVSLRISDASVRPSITF
jgi:hypothetical protein